MRKKMKLSFSSYHKAKQNCLSQTLSYLLKRKISIFLFSLFIFPHSNNFASWLSKVLQFISCVKITYILSTTPQRGYVFMQLILCFHKKSYFKASASHFLASNWLSSEIMEPIAQVQHKK